MSYVGITVVKEKDEERVFKEAFRGDDLIIWFTGRVGAYVFCPWNMGRSHDPLKELRSDFCPTLTLDQVDDLRNILERSYDSVYVYRGGKRMLFDMVLSAPGDTRPKPLRCQLQNLAKT